jgi:hypothetical protein
MTEKQNFKTHLRLASVVALSADNEIADKSDLSLYAACARIK